MQIVIAGGSGFIGSELIGYLLNHTDSRIWIITRNPKRVKLLFPNLRVDVLDLNRGWEFLKGEISAIEPDSIINLVGILYETEENTYKRAHIEFVKHLVEAAKQVSNLKRFVHISACGVDKNSYSKYFRTKLKGEETVVLSGLPYTIFRPSIVMGKSQLLLKQLKKFSKITPIFVVPKAKVQPIHVLDLIEAVYKAITNNNLKNKICEVGGPKVMSMKEFFEKTLQKLGIKRPVIELPWYFFVPLLPILSPLGIMSWEQLQMVRSENICPQNCLEKILQRVRDPFDF
jgi:uncharacterized protein YbjT (DUF2867 family)